MEKLIGLALAALLTLTPLGCAEQKPGAADGGDSITASYYVGQEDRAYAMFQKNIFQNLADDWTGEETAAWNYDSFAKYEILDHAMGSVAKDEALYYCTYSAEGGKCGYVVLQYTGDGISRFSLMETPYLYDLREALDELLPLLEDTELDLSTAVASRIKLVDTDKNRSDEAIRFTDEAGHEALYGLAEKALL